MKKYGKICLIIMSLIVIGCITSSCSFSSNDKETYNLYFENNVEWVDNKFALIKETINSRDTEQFKKLFAPNVYEGVEGFDEDIEELFEFIEGEIISIDNTTGFYTSKDADYGKIQKRIFSWTTMKTSEAEYHISIREEVYDNVDRDNEGIFTFKIFNEKDRESVSFLGVQEEDPSGIIIHNPEDYSITSPETTK